MGLCLIPSLPFSLPVSRTEVGLFIYQTLLQMHNVLTVIKKS